MNPLSRAGRQFIAGAWVASASAELLPVTDPSTEQVIAHVCQGAAGDADRAVSAARGAQAGWSARPLAERVAVIRRTAEILTRHAEDLARLVSREVGTPLAVSRAAQVGRPIAVLSSLCDGAEALAWRERIDATLVVREPLGVVAAITPWNFPLHQVAVKAGAALLAGCTVVLKPSELAPLSAYALADALAEAGLPAGVFNVVTGGGATLGAALTAHPGVDGISFTGSTAVGRRIGAAAAETVKRVVLELGGKGPAVVLPGADVAAAAEATAARCFTNSGQVCAALSRLIVPRAALPEAEQVLGKVVARERLGDPADENSTLGPLISAAQRDRVQRLVAQAITDGARLVAGGPSLPVPARGYYVAPTVFFDVTPQMPIARAEVFGPVLCVLAYDDVKDAVRIANDTEYGLVAAVWGPDVNTAVNVAASLRAGMVGVNGGRINVKAPFGGYNQSGNGREFGRHGIEEFLELKSVNFVTDSEITWPAA